ncbi:MAG: DUF4956 domain-containing protein [Lachnospiraceae bacterium]|nr:DUF4956 domain-containing protein [Lachnospiraceae bacterium]
MGRRDILEWFSTNAETLSVSKIVFVLCMAMILAAVVFITYRLTYTGVSYNSRFNATNVIILLITTVIMLMIGSNIAISLGMVGALSIVRYRTAIKDPHDTVYIFWSIVEGLCVGAQIYKLAVISTLFIALVLIGFSFYTRIFRKYLIVVRGNAALDPETVKQCIDSKYKKVQLRSVNTTESRTEMIYEVALTGELDVSLVTELRKMENVAGANWLLETGESVG